MLSSVSEVTLHKEIRPIHRRNGGQMDRKRNVVEAIDFGYFEFSGILYLGEYFLYFYFRVILLNVESDLVNVKNVQSDVESRYKK